MFARLISKLSQRHTFLGREFTMVTPTRTLANQQVAISAVPSPALVDEKTKYKIQGLDSGQYITFVAVLRESRGTFISHAHFIADSKGCVDTWIQESLGGSYKGVEPMGLLWSMKPEEGSLPGLRLHKKDVTIPFDVQFYVLPDFRDIKASSGLESSEILCSLQHPRTYMGPGVRRLSVREGNLRGSLFLPPGNGPFPAVIDLFGTAGGLTEFRSALFASQGIASLALAYFGFEDLNKNMIWNMEYFEEAVDWLSSHPDILKSGIGTIGVSKGTELATYMAIYSNKVKAVVSINPYHYYSFADHYKDGILQPTVTPNFEALIMDPEGVRLDQAYWTAEVPEETLVPIERAGAHFLFINGEDDYLASPKHTDLLIERLRKHGHSNFTLLRYPSTGHLIEPPYTPHSRVAYHKLFGSTMLFGGSTKEHSDAQENSWLRILEFFKTRLANNYLSKPVQSPL